MTMATKTETPFNFIGFDFELRKIQKCPAMEGYAYYAEVLINGFPVCSFNDDGCGGMARIEPLAKYDSKDYAKQDGIIKGLNNYLKKNYCMIPTEEEKKCGLGLILKLDIELFLSHLVENIAHQPARVLKAIPFSDKQWKKIFNFTKIDDKIRNQLKEQDRRLRNR